VGCSQVAAVGDSLAPVLDYLVVRGNQVFDYLCYTYTVDKRCHNDVAHHLKILIQLQSQR
jgi:hypothetical protein